MTLFTGSSSWLKMKHNDLRFFWVKPTKNCCLPFDFKVPKILLLKNLYDLPFLIRDALAPWVQVFYNVLDFEKCKCREVFLLLLLLFFPKLLHCDFYQKEKAPKWQNEENLMDGLTTNGILLMNPKGGPSCQPTIWREISVCGNVYGLRRTRSTTEKGKTVSFRCLLY